MKKNVLVGFETWPRTWEATMLTVTRRDSYEIIILIAENIKIQLLRDTIS